MTQTRENISHSNIHSAMLHNTFYSLEQIINQNIYKTYFAQYLFEKDALKKGVQLDSPFNLLTSEACLSRLNAYLNSQPGWACGPRPLCTELGVHVCSPVYGSRHLHSVGRSLWRCWAALRPSSPVPCPKHSRWERCQESHFSLAGAPGCQQWGFEEALQQKTRG